MSAFTGRLALADIAVGSDAWELIEPLSYDVGCEGSGLTVRVPPGFVSDLVSAPWFVAFVVRRYGRARRAAVIHDWLYHLLRANTPLPHAPDRWTADRVFHEALIVSGVWPPLAFAMFVAVRVFGGRFANGGS